MKKIISFLCSISIFTSYFNTNNSFKADAAETIKIMSIGDSITDGYGTDGSYRKFLYHELTEKGYSIDMTGPNWSWGDADYVDAITGESFSYDAAHCGYSGYAIEEYNGRNGILETIKAGDYLNEYSPDIVILQIGTNDVIDNHEIDTAGKRLEELTDYILENISPDSVLFVTTIPDLEPNRNDVYAWFSAYRNSSDWSIQYTDDEAEKMVSEQIKNYNSQVKEVVFGKQAQGISNIYFGDINSVITDTSEQLKDGVHPNDVGYKLMGNYWAEVLLNYLSKDKTDIKIGDINEDGNINAADILLLQQHLIMDYEIKNADLNQDNIVNILDFILLKNKLIEK